MEQKNREGENFFILLSAEKKSSFFPLSLVESEARKTLTRKTQRNQIKHDGQNHV